MDNAFEAVATPQRRRFESHLQQIGLLPGPIGLSPVNGLDHDLTLMRMFPTIDDNNQTTRPGKPSLPTYHFKSGSLTQDDANCSFRISCAGCESEVASNSACRSLRYTAGELGDASSATFCRTTPFEYLVLRNIGCGHDCRANRNGNENGFPTHMITCLIRERLRGLTPFLENCSAVADGGCNKKSGGLASPPPSGCV